MLIFESTKEVDFSSGEEIWLIMNSVTGDLAKYASLPHVHVVPELAPEQSLYQDFLKWKRNCNWDQSRFDKEFSPRYIGQISNSQEAINKLTELMFRKEENIHICCSCMNESMCHRILLARMLYGTIARNYIKVRDIRNLKPKD